MDLNSHSGFALLGKYIHAVIEFDYTLKLDLTVNLPSWRSNHWETCQWLLYDFCSLNRNLFIRTVPHPWIESYEPRLSILALLRARVGNFCAHFAIKCSSFCQINVGTSQRSACNSLGNLLYPSVQASNMLLERTSGCTLCKLALTIDFADIYPYGGLLSKSPSIKGNHYGKNMMENVGV